MANEQELAVLYVSVKAKTDELQKQLDALKNNVKSSSKEMSDSFKAVTAGFLTADLIKTTARAVADFFIKAVGDARNAAVTFAQVEQAVQQTGGAAGYSAKELQSTAKALEDIVAVDADDILQNITLQLLTFTNIQGEAFKRAQEAALDLSAVLGTDLKGQTIQLAKALEDPVRGITALSRAGVTFTDEQKDLIQSLVESGDLFSAQTVILDEINAKYGGQAKIIAESDGGYKKLNVTLGNITKSIGEDLIGSADEGTGAILELAEAFDSLNTAVKDVSGGVGIIGETINALKILATLGGSIGQDKFMEGFRIALKKYQKELEETVKKTRENLKALNIEFEPKKITPITPRLSTDEADKILAAEVDKKRQISEIDNKIHQLQLEDNEANKDKIKILEDARKSLVGTNDDKKKAIEERKKIYEDFYNNIKFLSDNYYAFSKKQLDEEVKKLREAKVSELDIQRWYNEQLKQLEINRIRASADATLKELQTASNNKRSGIIQTPSGPIIQETTASQDLIQNARDRGRNVVNTVETKGLKTPQEAFTEAMKQSEESSRKTAQNLVNGLDASMSAVNNIANTLSIGADTFVGKLLSGLNSAVSIADSIANVIMAFSGDGVGGIFSFLFGHSGGTFQDGRKIASFAQGGSFIVPPGFPNDSFPLLVESGERVTVTPSNAVNKNSDSEYLKAVVGRLDALNMNIINNRPIVNNNVNVDGITFTKKVVNESNRKISNSGYKNFNEYSS